MLRTFGWFYYALGLGWLLGKIRMEDHTAERIRAAAAEGPIVYVLLQRSAVDHLALNTVLNRRRLPLSVWANGITSFYWQPVLAAWRELIARWRRWLRDGAPPDPVSSGFIRRTVAAEAPITLFLSEESTPGAWFRGRTDGDPVSALFDAQKDCERPIQLVPLLVVWDRSPDKKGSVMRHFIEGSREAPSRLAQLRNLFFRTQTAFIQVGDPVSLPEFEERVGDPQRQTRALRLLLRRYLSRESRVIRGPRLLPHATMRRLVLDNPPMRELAEREAAAQGVSTEKIQRKMEKEYDAIASRFRWWIIRAADVVLRPLWTRIYSGVDVRPEDMERIRTAMRGGTAILVPSHKSHFDYLLLAWVFYANDLIIPHVVAGMNLAIWPLSVFFRGCGGFFIKRSFGGERIFPEVFSRYLRELIRHGYPVEFFIEGGRTRSGKLLRPRVGVLDMVLEASVHTSSNHEVTILPIALAYEQVAEENAYAAELGGEEKKPESMGQLMKARSVLKRRFGRVYLRVGEPILTKPIVTDVRGRPWEELSRAERKEELDPIGERIIYRIGRATVVLPTSIVALGLLAHHRRAIPHDDLVERIDRFRALLRAKGADETASMERFSQARTDALARFERGKLVAAHSHGGERLWAIVPDRRIRLEFYKNQLLHWFQTEGYAVLALRARASDVPFRAEELADDFRTLTWVWRREFILSPDASSSEQLQEALTTLVTYGALSHEDGTYRIADTGRLGEIYGLFRTFVESYVVVLQAIEDHPGLDRKALVSAIQKDADTLTVAGVLSRPEALSRENLSNAVAVYTEDDVFLADGDGRLRADPTRRASLLARLKRMLE